MKTITNKRNISSNKTVKEIPAIKPVPSNGNNFNEKIKVISKRLDDMVMISIEKAAAHFEDPSAYPITTDNKSIERAFYNLLEALPRLKRNRVIDKINETLKAGTDKRINLYGDLANVNFRSAVAISEQVREFLVPQNMKITEAETAIVLESVKSKNIKRAVPQPGVDVSASKLSLVLDTITCINPDDIRKDEISLAGFILDPLANKIDIVQFSAGDFKKGDVVPLNRELAQVNIAGNFPESYVSSLFIIESDLISNPETTDKIKAVMAAVGYTIAIASVFVPFVAPFWVFWVVLGVGSTIMFSRHLMGLLNDDISLAVEDILTVPEKVDVGDTFDRNLKIGKGFSLSDSFDGEYALLLKWVGIA